MISGVLGSFGSLNDDDRFRTDPISLPPGTVAAIVADAAPLCVRPVGVVKVTLETLMLQLLGLANGELLME